MCRAVLAQAGLDEALPRLLNTAVVRPTPGAADEGTLTRDVMSALGKHSTGALSALTDRWARCHAWMAAAGVQDLIVDRAGRLPAARLEHLARMAATTGTSLWLLWSASAPERAARITDRSAAAIELVEH